MEIPPESIEEITPYLLTLKQDVDPPADFEIEFVKVDENTQIRCLRFVPENTRYHLVIVPGLNTLLMSWYKLLVFLKHEGFEITYIETREKITSIMINEKEFSEQAFLDEITFAITKYAGEREYAVLGASMGSNNLIKCINRGMIKPNYAFFTGTLMKFKIPFLVNIVKPFWNKWSYKWIFEPLMQAFVVPSISNKKKDPFQRKKYRLAIKSINPIKSKHAFYAYTGTHLLNDLEQLNNGTTKYFFVGAGTDKLHGDDSMKTLNESVSGSNYVHMESNYDTHDKPMVDLLIKALE